MHLSAPLTCQKCSLFNLLLDKNNIFRSYVNIRPSFQCCLNGSLMSYIWKGPFHISIMSHMKEPPPSVYNVCYWRDRPHTTIFFHMEGTIPYMYNVSYYKRTVSSICNIICYSRDRPPTSIMSHMEGTIRCFII